MHLRNQFSSTEKRYIERLYSLNQYNISVISGPYPGIIMLIFGLFWLGCVRSILLTEMAMDIAKIGKLSYTFSNNYFIVNPQ